MTWWKKIPMPLIVTPALRGLKVVDSDDTTEASIVYPWKCVGGNENVWYVYDENGKHIHKDGWPVTLKFKERDKYSVAKRAQARYFKHALDQEDFQLEETYKSTHSDKLAGALVVSMLGCGFCVFLILALKLWNNDWEPPFSIDDMPMARFIAVLSFIACALSLLFVIRTATHKVDERNATSAKFSSDGVSLELSDGRHMSSRWVDMTSIRAHGGYAIIDFHDGLRVSLRGVKPYTISLLDAAKDLYHAIDDEDVKRIKKRAGIRGVLLLASLATALYALPALVGPPGWLPMRMRIMSPIITLVLGSLIFLGEWIQKLENYFQRRNQK